MLQMLTDLSMDRSINVKPRFRLDENQLARLKVIGY